MGDHGRHQETWKPVPGVPYEASSSGHIRRTSFSTQGQARRWGGRILGEWDGGGQPGNRYLRVHCKGFGDQSGHLVFVHVLVAMAFLGAPPGPRGSADGHYQVNHKNGNRKDNRPENLEWVTCSENHKHAFANTRRPQRGVDRPMAKLDDDKVREIRRRYRASGRDAAIELSGRFGVSINHIVAVATGRRWQHVLES